MKHLLILVMVLTSIAGLTGCKNSSDPSSWNTEDTDSWFKKGEWLNNWNVLPDSSINRKALAVAYFKNKERWNEAFTFLKSNDLLTLGLKRYDIDGDNVYATVSEYLSKNDEDAKFEAHRKYIDVQYVISGEEQMGLAPLSQKKDVLESYDPVKDLEFMSVGQSSTHIAKPDRFFIFFPSDIHRPGVKVDDNSNVRKIVIKIKVD